MYNLYNFNVDFLLLTVVCLIKRTEQSIKIMLQKQIEEQRERDKQQQTAQTSLQGRPSSSELYEGKVKGQGL